MEEVGNDAKSRRLEKAAFFHTAVYYLAGGGLAVIVCLTSIKVTTQGMHIVRGGRNFRMHLGVGYLKPDLFVDYAPLGYSYMMLGEKKKAGKLFKMALRHNPSDAFARRCLNGL